MPLIEFTTLVRLPLLLSEPIPGIYHWMFFPRNLSCNTFEGGIPPDISQLPDLSTLLVIHIRVVEPS